MSITFPRTLPDTIASEFTLSLDDGYVAATHSRGRAGTQSRIIEPTWRLKLDTGGMDFTRRAAWSAWKNSLEGRLFLAWDASLPEPLAYPGGHPSTIDASWNGEATVTALTATTIALSGLPANFIFTPGDRIGLRQTVSSVVRYGYHEVLTAVTASGAGVATVTVGPQVHPVGGALFTTSAVAVIRRPLVAMQMRAGSWRMDVNATVVSASFEADQVL